MPELTEIAGGFVTLLLLPTLGVLALLRKRAIPVLGCALGLWTAFGAWALITGHTLGWSEQRFRHHWLLGIGLGTVFLAVAWLCKQPRVAGWVKLGLGALTVSGFLRALYLFVRHYA